MTLSIRMLLIAAVAAMPAAGGAQQKAPAKADTAKKAAAPAHDMSKMAGDTGMKHDMKAMGGMGGMQHDMSKMGGDSTMKHEMGGMGGMGGGMGAMGGGMERKSGWNELDGFHALMMGAWHPVQQGDLKPARLAAPQLLAAALKWRSSKGPAACDTPKAREGFPLLIESLRSYADAAKREASNDAVEVTLKASHQAFEAIAMPCMMAAMPKK